VKLLAMLSGGVDSAVAAALAADDGHEVTAVHLALARTPAGQARARGCCTPEDARDAARVADLLGLPSYVWDLSEQFSEVVVQDLVSDYAQGLTPNPCMRCNERVKFAAVLDRALALGFDAVVTGHHARLSDGVLSRSADMAKDQSYVLGTLRPEQLQRAVLPLGALTKDEVRRIAAVRGLPVAAKPDSHDVCFVPQGGMATWLHERLGEQPGPVLDRDGTELGRHRGAYAFTVGQRHGLGIAGPEPRYVLSVEPVSRTVTVGPREALDVAVLHVRTAARGACRVQVRAHGASVPAVAYPDHIELPQPLRGVAPGQAAVVYDGEDHTVIGGGWISSTTPWSSKPSSQRLVARP
jgi:tRNA-specific 2-thiouridylase